MSVAIASTYGTISTLIRSVDKLTTQNNALIGEETSGVVSDSVAGLGDQTYNAVNLSPQIAEISAWQSNLTQIQSKLSVTQTALSSMSAIATTMQASLLSIDNTASASSITAIANEAKQYLKQLNGLLNIQSGDHYVFSGAASDQQTVTVDLSTISGTATPANLFSAAVMSVSTTQPVSGDVSVAAPQVSVGPNRSVSNGASISLTSFTSLVQGLTTIAGLGSTSSGSTGFTQLLSATANQLQSAGSSIQDMITAVGQTQSQATAQSSSLSDISAALTSQLDTIMNADTATVLTQQRAVQDQLTASYTLIANMKSLNLAQYL